MTRPTARVLELLDLLQSAGSRSTAELATRLDVDERTVRRYVEHLRDLDVPVESVRGRLGGYRISPGYRMPPLMLDDDEALAVLTGLAALRSDSVSPIAATTVETAIAKLRRAVPQTLAERISTLLDTAVTAPDDHAASVDPDVLLTIAEAVRELRPLSIRYRSRNGSETDRTLQPHDLVARARRWYVAGWDPARQDVRTLRLDRIRRVRLLPGTFSAPAAHDVAGELVERFARADYAHTVRLRVQSTRERIERVLPRTVGVIDEPHDGDEPGWLRVEIHAERLDWLPRVMLELDALVVIDEPDSLREVVAAAARRLSEMAATTD